jgi:hypothetical protein
MDHLLQRLEALEDQVRLVQRRLRRWQQLAGSGLVLALVCLLQPWALAAQAPGKGPDRTLWQRVNLWRRVNVLERTLTHVTSVTGAGGLPEVVITGANLRLVNGLRATATTNGLGNLLVGYNESREGENVHTGSHNVVVGQGRHFSSFGGLVVGRQNEISGAFAAVSGGIDNTASGASAAVSGGHGNTAGGPTAAISGGEANTASGLTSAVSGGRNHTARGDFDWVAGRPLRPCRETWLPWQPCALVWRWGRSAECPTRVKEVVTLWGKSKTRGKAVMQSGGSANCVHGVGRVMLQI